MVIADIFSGTSTKKYADCVPVNSESIKVLTVIGLPAGQTLTMKSSCDNENWFPMKFMDESAMVITEDMQIELPTGRYKIKAEYSGDALPDGLEIRLN